MSAIFIGRFQPFHKGHLAAIKWILEKEKKVFVVIGSNQEFFLERNPFSFRERKKMINSALRAEELKGVKIFSVPDYEEDFLWAKKILEITKANLKSNPLVFTCNPWTKKCFEKIGVKVVCHPIFLKGLSATEVRKKMQKGEKWRDLVPEKVFDFLKKIKGEERIKNLAVPPERKIVTFIKEQIKRRGAKGGVVGLSGGIDSSLVAVLARKALGKKIKFFYIPFVQNSFEEKNISLLEKKLNVKAEKICLQGVYDSLAGILPKGNNLTEGNLKSRIRMAVLYYFANLLNFLVIGTENKSELEIGYFTKYGDGAVDIMPLGGLYKTEVIEMAKRLKLPKEIIAAVPTAGLWKNQTDEKEIGVIYQKLDTLLKLLKQNFKKKEISFLLDIPLEKVESILRMKKKNNHKLSYPPIFSISGPSKAG